MLWKPLRAWIYTSLDIIGITLMGIWGEKARLEAGLEEYGRVERFLLTGKAPNCKLIKGKLNQ